MSRRNVNPGYTWALAIGFVLGGATLVSAAGYWNVPGNCCQRCGYGNGPGYHAPLILGPIRCDGWGPPNEIRLPHSPNPYGCSPMNAGYGGPNGCGCQTSQMYGPPRAAESVEMAPAAATTNTPPPALFEAPVQP